MTVPPPGDSTDRTKSGPVPCARAAIQPVATNAIPMAMRAIQRSIGTSFVTQTMRQLDHDGHKGVSRHLRFLGASSTTSRLDPLGELSARGPVVRTSLAMSRLIEAGLHVCTKLLARMVALLQKPERLADHFAGGLVQTTRDFLVYESFELWCQRNVHADLILAPRLNPIADIVNI